MGRLSFRFHLGLEFVLGFVAFFGLAKFNLIAQCLSPRLHSRQLVTNGLQCGVTRQVARKKWTTSMSTDKRGNSLTNRLIAVPRFMANASVAKTAGATSTSNWTV